MFPAQTLKQLNCSHKVERYFDIDSKWTLEDYCYSCQESINEIENNKD